MNNMRGFRVKIMMMYPEFNCLDAELKESGVHFNPAGTRDHVPLCEKSIRTQKERTRCTWSRLPCREHMPKIVTIGLVKFNTVWRNISPRKSSIGNTLSPMLTVIGVPFNHKNHCKT